MSQPPKSTILAPSLRCIALSAVFLSVWPSAVEDKCFPFQPLDTGDRVRRGARRTTKGTIRVLQGSMKQVTIADIFAPRSGRRAEINLFPNLGPTGIVFTGP